MLLGIGVRGDVAENHHVCPIHPEYAELPSMERDLDEARRLMEEAGQMDFEHELISIDDDYRRATADAIAAQLREAGFTVNRQVLPPASYWNDWAGFPYSISNWAMRPLGVQVLAIAYRSGQAWNETQFSDPEFDAKLDEALSISDPDERRTVMAELQTILRSSGIIVQPYWMMLYNHSAPEVRNHGVHPTYELNFERVWLDNAG